MVVASHILARRLRLEPREARVRHDQPADRLPRATVVLVRDRNLEVAAEEELAEVPAELPARLLNEANAVLQPLDVRADGEADAVRHLHGYLDRLRAGGRHVDRRLRQVEPRIDVVCARGGEGETCVVELDVLAA